MYPNIFLKLSLTIWLLTAPFCVSWAQSPSSSTTRINEAGELILVEGDVTITDNNETARVLRVGDPVFEGDKLVTGNDGEVHIQMDDGGFIVVRPNTTMRIVLYQALGHSDDRSVFALLKGSFRSITGWIGKFNSRNYQIKTPTATIGVRGTDHEPLVIPEGSADGEPGTYEKVNAGETLLSTVHGNVHVAEGTSAFSHRTRREAPHTLKEIPQFFKGGAHEHLLKGKHEAIRQIIDQRRAERRTLVREHRKEFEEHRRSRLRLLEQRRQEHREKMQKHAGAKKANDMKKTQRLTREKTFVSREKARPAAIRQHRRQTHKNEGK